MHDKAPQQADPGFPNLLGHPRPLWMLLLVTVGFNFGIYGFRAFLAPYLAQAFFAQLPTAQAIQHAEALASSVMALIYATHLLGGYVADHLLGDTRALWLSLVLQTLTIAFMAWPTLAGFELGAASFVLATGLSIPLTVLVGRTYGPDDPRRDGGFTLYYLAINIGAFVAPLVCADWVGSHYGYRFGFIAASLGTMAAAIALHIGKNRLRGIGAPPPGREGPRTTLLVLLGMLALIYPVYLLLAHPQWLNNAAYLLIGVLVVYFLQSGIRSGRVQLHRYIAMLILYVAYVGFWALSLQGVTSLNFLARDYVHAPFDFTWFQSANPLYILLFAPLMAVLWPWLDKRGINPSTPRKFGIGLAMVGLSYLIMVVAIRHAQAGHSPVSWLMLAGCYLVQTLGELTLSPIGYAMVTRLAAPHEASLAMGGWFLGMTMSYSLSGQIAAMTVSSADSGLAGYAHVYHLLFWLGLGVGLLYLLAAPGIRKLMHGAH